MMNRIRQVRGGVLKIYDEPDSPSKRGVFKIYDDSGIAK